MALADEICRIDAFSLAAAIRVKQLSPVEVVEALIDRMALLDAELHAFCTPTPELALKTPDESRLRSWQAAMRAYSEGAGKHQGSHLHQGCQDDVGDQWSFGISSPTKMISRLSGSRPRARFFLAKPTPPNSATAQPAQSAI